MPGLGEMMQAVSEFVTVFEIARGSNGVFADACFRLLIGIGALVGGVTALVFKRNNNGLKSWDRSCICHWLEFVVALPA